MKEHWLGAVMMSSLLFLQGCTTVATSGASAIYNHQRIEKYVHDEYITMRSYQALDIDSDDFKNTNVNISTFNNVVLLTGQVREDWQKTEAEQKVRKVAGNADIYNLINIAKPASQWRRLSDAWLTAKIKAKLIASSDLDASQVKVVTEDGKVFLMGILRLDEAQAVINAASHTSGVREVVKVFSYISISRSAGVLINS